MSRFVRCASSVKVTNNVMLQCALSRHHAGKHEAYIVNERRYGIRYRWSEQEDGREICDCRFLLFCEDCGEEIPATARSVHENAGHPLSPIHCELCESKTA